MALFDGKYKLEEDELQQFHEASDYYAVSFSADGLQCAFNMFCATYGLKDPEAAKDAIVEAVKTVTAEELTMIKELQSALSHKATDAVRPKRFDLPSLTDAYCADLMTPGRFGGTVEARLLARDPERAKVQIVSFALPSKKVQIVNNGQ